MKVEVVTPEEYSGDVIGDLNRRRGQITGMDETPAGKVITAEVPLSEMFGYATTVRSMSQGRATFTMEFSKYVEVPPQHRRTTSSQGTSSRCNVVSSEGIRTCPKRNSSAASRT